MSRSSDARRLRAELSAETGVSVLVQWTTSAAGQRMRWHVIWAGGPTVDGMTAFVDRLLPAGSALDRDKLLFQRTVDPVAVALAVARNLRLGLNPLGDHISAGDLEHHLHDIPYPERGTRDDLQLAGVLVGLAAGDTEQILQLATQRGFAGLREQLAEDPAERPDIVLPFRRPERR